MIQEGSRARSAPVQAARPPIGERVWVILRVLLRAEDRRGRGGLSRCGTAWRRRATRRRLRACNAAPSSPPPVALPLAARAQPAWPDRPVRFIVPWPPGGLNDLVARAFNDPVARALGQPIVNDFRAGAGGRIGVAEVARAVPDGYTIGMGNLGPLTIFPHLFRDIPYDAARDLISIVMFAASPLVLVVANDVPAQDAAGIHRLGPRPAGQIQLCQRRRRHRAAPDLRDVQAARRHRHRARPLPRHE